MSDPEALQWLNSILWPDGAARISAIDSVSLSAPVAHDNERWWASPSAGDPKILVPGGSVSAGRTATKRYHDGFDAKLRARSFAAERLSAWGPLAKRAMSGRELKVVANTPNTHGLLDELRELMKVEELFVAIGLSHPKANRKPVLQLIDHEGRCIGWAKVGWNETTRTLISNEAAWLQQRPVPPLAIPRVLHDEELAGHQVVVVNSVQPRRRPSRSRFAPPPYSIFRSVAAMGALQTTSDSGHDVDGLSLSQTAWWLSVEDALSEASADEEELIRSVPNSLSTSELLIGGWHGDLTPWNLMTDGERVNLIDWEFAADEVPVGFDLYHFYYQVARELRRLDASASLDYAARLAPHGLIEMGVAKSDCFPVWTLYLVELARRGMTLRADRRRADDNPLMQDSSREALDGFAAIARLRRMQTTKPVFAAGTDTSR